MAEVLSSRCGGLWVPAHLTTPCSNPNSTSQYSQVKSSHVGSRTSSTVKITAHHCTKRPRSNFYNSHCDVLSLSCLCAFVTLSERLLTYFIITCNQLTIWQQLHSAHVVQGLVLIDNSLLWFLYCTVLYTTSLLLSCVWKVINYWLYLLPKINCNWKIGDFNHTDQYWLSH